MNMLLVADLFGFCGMVCFLFATVKQWHKIYSTKHIKAISVTSYKSRIIAGFCTMMCFFLTGLWLSLAVVTIELTIAISIIYMLFKYRRLRK